MTDTIVAFDAQWGWLIAAAVLGIAELLVPGVFLIWIGLAALLTGVLALLLPIEPVVQGLIFAAATTASIYAGRRVLARNPIVSDDPLLNDRVARLVGERVLVTSAIVGGRGRVRVGDGEWTARGPDLPAGARARVTGGDAGVLNVEAENER